MDYYIFFYFSHTSEVVIGKEHNKSINGIIFLTYDIPKLSFRSIAFVQGIAVFKTGIYQYTTGIYQYTTELMEFLFQIVHIQF